MYDRSLTSVCVFEDRRECILGVKLLVLSAKRHEPKWLIHAFMKGMSNEDIEWLSNQPNVIVREEIWMDRSGWNVKPSLLKKLLIETGGPVIWCDSDLILAAPISDLIAAPDNYFVATEEYRWGATRGSRIRVAGWGFVEGRTLPMTVNSCLIKVTMSHVDLLDAWDTCLSDKGYVLAQAMEWHQRPIHLMSDQDVLTALLASDTHATVTLHLLKNGIDIAQCFQEDGYTVCDRLRNWMMGRLPPLVHAQGGKPWKKGARAYYQQLSPYAKIAAPYVKNELLPDYWIKADDLLARLMDTVLLKDPNLCGIILACQRYLSRVWHKRPLLFRLR